MHNPIRLVMRKASCQICHTEINVREVNPFIDSLNTDFHTGYQYCDNCKPEIMETLKNMNELCKKMIEKKIDSKYDFKYDSKCESKYDSFDIKTFSHILKNKKLIVKRSNNDIENDWKFNGYIFYDEFYIIVSNNDEDSVKSITLVDFLDYNYHLFL